MTINIDIQLSFGDHLEKFSVKSFQKLSDSSAK